MKKFLLLIIAVLLVLPGVAQAQSDTLSRDQINTISKSVVLVLSFDASGQPYASGSGTIISSTGLIYTNRHVLEGGADFGILIPSDVGEPAKLVYYASPKLIHQDVDFAELQIDRDANGKSINASTLNLPTIPLADSLPQIGDRIVVFGYPSLGDAHLVVTSGSVTTIENDTLNNQRIPYWYQTDAQISPGNSGGLVVNLDGQMVGIPTKVDAEGETLGRLGGILSDSAIRGALQTPTDSLQLPLQGVVPDKFSNEAPPQQTPEANQQTSQNGTQQLTIQITKIEENATYQNDKGIMVHTTAEADGYNGVPIRAALFAFWQDGTPIPANNRVASDSRTSKGGLTAQQVVTPSYDASQWDDLWFFIPYNIFPDGRTGSFPGYLEAQIGPDGQDFAAFSDDKPFNYTYPDKQLVVDITNVEHDVTYNNTDGMKVHTHINTLGYQGQKLRVALFLYWADGTPIPGGEAPAENRTKNTSALTVQDVLTPEYDNSDWSDFWFFVPYTYFPTGLKGDQDAYVEAEIGLDSGDFTSWSLDENFTLTYDK